MDWKEIEHRDSGLLQASVVDPNESRPSALGHHILSELDVTSRIHEGFQIRPGQRDSGIPIPGLEYVIHITEIRQHII